MNYEIVQLDEFDGKIASIYSIMLEGEDSTLFDQFIYDYNSIYPDEILSILTLIKQMNCKLGVRENLIKIEEGKPGDGVIAVYDNPDKKLRLYGIRLGSGILILGDGGEKDKSIRAWQEDDILKDSAELMIEIREQISQRIKNREISFSDDYNEIEGDLNFINNDYE